MKRRSCIGSVIGVVAAAFAPKRRTGAEMADTLPVRAVADGNRAGMTFSWADPDADIQDVTVLPPNDSIAYTIDNISPPAYGGTSGTARWITSGPVTTADDGKIITLQAIDSGGRTGTDSFELRVVGNGRPTPRK